MAAVRHPGPECAVNVLYIASKMLSPNTDGASLRGINMIRSLIAVECQVTFVAHHARSFPPYDETLEEDTARLQRLGVEVPVLADHQSIVQHLVDHGDEYDLVILTPYPIACRYVPLIRRHSPRAIAVYDALDLGHLQLFRHAKLTKNVPELRRALEAKKQEIWLAENCDCTIVCNDDERAVVLDFCPNADVRVAAHVVERRESSSGYADRSGLMFLGSFPHVANVDAMLLFVRDILPGIRESLPDVELRIVGAQPPAEIRALASSRITVTGRVPELESHFSRARVFVAPLRHGAGIKIKVLESLGHGVPTVATPVAAEGLHLSHGADALIADTADEFAQAVIRLYGDEDLWRRLVSAGFDLIDRRFSRSAMESTLRGVLSLAGCRR